MILGVIGLVLPVIPQIPFLIVGIVFLTSGSKKIKNKLLQSNLYNNHMKDNIEKNKILSKIWNKMIG